MNYEQLKLLQQDSARLLYFTQYLFEIKVSVTCSICLDILEKPIQVSCLHLFCESCIQTLLKYHTKEAPCPICQKAILKRTAFKVHQYYFQVADFVKKQLKQLNTILNLDVDEKTSYEDILSKVKQQNITITCRTYPGQPKKTISFKLDTNDTKCNELKVGRNVKLFSPNIDDNSSTPQTMSSVNDGANNKSSTEDSMDPFDRLKKTTVLNKKPATKTYGNIRKVSNVVGGVENDLTTTKAICWLNDERNNFKVAPKTQESGKIIEEVPKFDMPSVSQLYNKKPTKKNESKRLTRSVGSYSKAKKGKKQLRHSTATCLSPKTAVIIEQFNSEEETKKLLEIPMETAALRDLEESYLDAIELDKEMIENKQNKANNHSEESSSKKVKTTSDVPSGWDRIKEMRKIINKSKKRTSKLKVIETPCTKSKKCVAINMEEEAKSKYFQPTVNLERLECSKLMSKSYNLNVIEPYMEQKLVEMCHPKSPKIQMLKKKVGLNKSLNKSQNINSVNENNENRNNLVDVCNKETSIMENLDLTNSLSKNCCNNLTAQENRDDEESLIKMGNEGTQRMDMSQKNIDKRSKSPNEISNCIRMEQTNENEIIEISQNVNVAIAQNTSGNENLKSKTDDDDIFLKPTQDIRSLDEQAEVLVNNNDDVLDVVETESIDEMYSLELDKINFTNSLLSKEFYKNVLDLNDVINKSKELTFSCKEEKKLNSFINNVKTALKNIMQSISEFTHLIPPVTKSICVQTSQPTVCTPQSHNITTQTAIPYNDKGIQTDSMDSSKCFRISTIDTFNIPVAYNVETQTEPAACQKCNYVVSCKNKTNSESIFLSESMDNLQFDTQDVLKRKVTNVDLQLNSSKNKNLSVDTFKQPQVSKSVSSASQDVISETVQQNPKKSNKRVRRLSFDNDSDNELLPKDVKRNKCIRENVSLFFESDLIDKAFVEEDRELLLTNDSEDLNYKKFLEKVLQRSEDFENVTVQQRDKSRQPPAKRSKTQEMIEECQKIIKQAYSSPLYIENTENITNTLLNNKYDQLQEPSKLTMSILDEEFEHDFHSNNKPLETTSDTVTQNKNTNNNFQNKEKCSESLFTNGENLLECNKSNQVSKSNIEELIDNFNALDDSFEDKMQSDNLPLENKSSDSIKKKIVIIQDICINKGDCSRNENTTENDKENLEENDCDLNKSADVFLSDSDIIETTPQKKKALSCEDLLLLSQCYYKPAPIILPPLLEESPDIISSLDPVPLSCFNKTFTPPFEFQDFNENQTVINVADVDLDDENDVTLKPVEEQVNNKQNVLSSVTPDIFLAQNYKINENSDNLISSTPFSENSQIISIRSLNLSPIRGEKSIKHQNPILAVQNSDCSPLNIVKCETPVSKKLHDFGTSTPKQKSILNYVQQTDLNVTQGTSQVSQYTYRKPNIACTRMSEEQMRTIVSLCNKKLVNYSKVFSSSVTHMIVSVDENQCVCDHTMKYVSAVAAGIWVLSFKWIEECLKRNCILPEEDFEALDAYGIDGPRRSRLLKLTKPLLKGYVIYAAPPFISTTQKGLESVIKLLGGEVVSRADDLKNKIGKVRLIITESRSEEDYDLFESWLETLKVITVDMEWLSRSVGQYEKINLRHYVLCSDDSIYDLGYPSELVTDSFSHLSSI